MFKNKCIIMLAVFALVATVSSAKAEAPPEDLIDKARVAAAEDRHNDAIQYYLSAIRSIVVGPDQVVRTTVVEAHEALVSIDGREDVSLAVGDVVEVRALERPIRLIEPRSSLPFWDLLRHKVELLPK